MHIYRDTIFFPGKQVLISHREGVTIMATWGKKGILSCAWDDSVT